MPNSELAKELLAPVAAALEPLYSCRYMSPEYCNYSEIVEKERAKLRGKLRELLSCVDTWSLWIPGGGAGYVELMASIGEKDDASKVYHIADFDDCPFKFCELEVWVHTLQISVRSADLSMLLSEYGIKIADADRAENLLQCKKGIEEYQTIIDALA